MHVVIPSSLCCRLTTSITSQTRPTRACREGAPSCVRGTPSTQRTAGSHAWWNAIRLVLPGDVAAREPGWRQLCILLNACCCERERERERERGLPMCTTGGKLKQQGGWWTCTDASILRPRVPGPGPFHAPSLHCCWCLSHLS
jgi:hypothetical protein